MAKVSPLRDIRIRLDRAENNFKRFDSELRAYFEGPPDPYGVRPEVDERGNGRVITYGAPIPDWSLLVADIITDLRSTLDYLAYQLVIRNTGQDPPPNWRRIEFPIFLREVDFFDCDKKGQPNKGSGLAKSMNMDADVQRFIWDVQPYKMSGADGLAENNGLWIFNELCNMYKHRLLSQVLLALLDRYQLSLKVIRGRMSVRDFTIHPFPTDLKNGAVLATFRLANATDSVIQVETQPTVYVVFEPGTAAERIPVWDLLNGLVGTVGWIVKELARKGDLS
jgi:hypothetical protein